MTGPRDDSAERLPFGPYAGETVDAVAVMDPDYLAGLVREAIGPPELRAGAAKALADRDRLWRPGVGLSQGLLAAARLLRTGRSPRFAAAAALLVSSALVVGQCADRTVRSLSATGVERSGVVGVVEDARNAGASQPATYTASAAVSTRRAPLAVADGVPIRTAVSATMPAGVVAPGPGGSEPLTAAVDCGSRIEGTVAAEEAQDWIDTYQAVEFRVVVAKDTGKVTFLNSHDPYKGYFYVVVFASDYDRFAEHPVHMFEGRCVVVQGTVEMYRGAPQIVLRDPADVRVLGE